MHFDRFDICEAWWLFATYWHTGQGSRLYRVLGRLQRMGFKPRPGLNAVHDLSENAQAIWLNLAKGLGKGTWEAKP